MGCIEVDEGGKKRLVHVVLEVSQDKAFRVYGWERKFQGLYLEQVLIFLKKWSGHFVRVVGQFWT